MTDTIVTTVDDSKQISSNSDLSFESPPSQDISFERPPSRQFEGWVETLKASPGDWAKLPSSDISRDEKALRKIPNIETLKEDGFLYCRYKPENFPAPVPKTVTVPPPSTFVANVRTPSSAGEASLMEPAVTPLVGGKDALFDNAPVLGAED